MEHLAEGLSALKKIAGIRDYRNRMAAMQKFLDTRVAGVYQDYTISQEAMEEGAVVESIKDMAKDNLMKRVRLNPGLFYPIDPVSSGDCPGILRGGVGMIVIAFDSGSHLDHVNRTRGKDIL